MGDINNSPVYFLSDEELDDCYDAYCDELDKYTEGELEAQRERERAFYEKEKAWDEVHGDDFDYDDYMYVNDRGIFNEDGFISFQVDEEDTGITDSSRFDDFINSHPDLPYLDDELFDDFSFDVQ